MPFDIQSYLSAFSPAKLQDLYAQFLGNFPAGIQPVVSLLMVGLIIYSVFRIIKRDFIFIIALIIFLPASIPVFKSVWGMLIAVIKYLLKLSGH